MADRDLQAEINSKLDELRDLMMEAGTDRTTAEALLFGARPSGPGAVTGNYADLQRMGSIAVTGKKPGDAVTPAEPASDVMDAFESPPPLPTPEELAAQSGSRPAGPSGSGEILIGGASTSSPEAKAAQIEGAEVAPPETGVAPPGPATTFEAAVTPTPAADAVPEAPVAVDEAAVPEVNLSAMTKVQLLDEADRRGVDADDSMTKAEIIAALGG